VVLNRRQRRSRRKIGGIQEQALDATFSFAEPVDKRLWLGPLLLRDVKVHDVLCDILELAKLLLQTCISIMLADQSQYIEQLRNIGQDAYHGRPLWSSP
jgi:hypothetical protein